MVLNTCVIADAKLRSFWQAPAHKDVEEPLKTWHAEAVRAEWTQPAHIKAPYGSASILRNRRVVFHIKGNEYRLVVALSYKLQIVYVKFVGTHGQYDAVDAETVEAD